MKQKPVDNLTNLPSLDLKDFLVVDVVDKAALNISNRNRESLNSLLPGPYPGQPSSELTEAATLGVALFQHFARRFKSDKCQQDSAE